VRPGWSGRGGKAQRPLIGWQMLAFGVKIGQQLSGGQAQCRLRPAPVGCGPSAYVLSKPTVRLAVWATPQGSGRGRQRSSIGGKGQPNKPINANWQAGFLLKLFGPAEFTNPQFSVADLANRVIGGR